MSWQQLVDQMLKNKPNEDNTAWNQNLVESAAIFGHDGGLWAITPNFNWRTYIVDILQDDDT